MATTKETAAPATTGAQTPTTDNATPVAVSKTPTTFTNWNALTIAGLRPTMIECQAYRPALRGDNSCHTRLLPKGESFSNHIAHEHGGGFRLSLRRSDGKASPLWAEIAELGLEAHDFRCAACGAEVRFHPTSIMQHMKPHQGMTKQAYHQLARSAPGAVGFFNVLIKKGRPEQALTDADEFIDDPDNY